MASHGRRKATVLRAVILLWLCSGLCVCMEETVADPDEMAKREDETDGGPLSPDSPPDEDGVPSQQDEAGPPDDETDTGSQDEPAAEDDGAEEGDGVSYEGEKEASEDESVGGGGEEEEKEEEEGGEEQEGDASSTEIPSTDSKEPSAPTEQATEPADQSPGVGDFVVRSESDSTICLRACFAATVRVRYVGEDDDGKAVNRTAEIPVPVKADAGGFCQRPVNKQAALILQWNDGDCVLKMTFRKENATKPGDPDTWGASRIQFTFDTADETYFDSAINAGQRTVSTAVGTTYFVTPQGNSRVCEAEDDVTMLPSAANQSESATLGISKLQLQPYGMNNGTFSEGVDCGKDILAAPNTNVASIAVGATLACLILVVILVYAVGRKMGAINDRTGYKSVE